MHEIPKKKTINKQELFALSGITKKEIAKQCNVNWRTVDNVVSGQPVRLYNAINIVRFLIGVTQEKTKETYTLEQITGVQIQKSRKKKRAKNL